jgi:hypothetical protein
MNHNFKFEHKGETYSVAFTSNATIGGQSGIGCHVNYLSGVGYLTINSIYKKTKRTYVDWFGKPQEEEAFVQIPDREDGWGVVHNQYGPIVEKFKDNQEELKNLFFTEIAKYISTRIAGAYIFSDPVNRGSSTKSGVLRILDSLGITGGPASFAKWLTQHPEYGPCWATPVFGNPLHRSRTDFSLAQIFIWVPKCNAWTVATDWGLPQVQPPVMDQYKSDNLLEEFAKTNHISKEQAALELQITHK